MLSTGLPGFENVSSLSAPLRRTALAALAAGVAGLALLARADLSPNPMFHPHGYCYLWEPALVGVHVTADTLIALSYLAISTTLVYLVRRARGALPFGWMVLTFGAFIVACGATHAMEVVTLWQPWFWTSADLKVVTAVASVGAALALPPLVPRIMVLFDSARVSEQRRLALESLNAELEARVAARTVELQAALTREQEARQRAEVAGLAKDNFLGLVSHELRTPLNAILGWSTMLLSLPASGDRLERAAGAIERNARVQAQLIDDLLDLTRIAAGKLRLVTEPVAIAAVVRSAIETIAPAVQARRQDLRVVDTTSGTFVLGDARRLQQLVWNLLSNAVKFTPERGTITVAIELSDKRVLVSVSDNGRGIDAQLLPHIFERFVQADSSSTRDSSGLGLGLSLAKELAEMHGGTVRADSRGRGEGSTFTIELPVLSADSRAIEPHPMPSVNVAALRGRCVLLVDDDPDTLELLTVGLTEFGVQVLPADSAAAAREQMLTGGSVDAIITDLAMPGEDGVSFVGDLRRRAIHIPVLAYTAQGRVRADWLPSGFNGWLSKPASVTEVLSALVPLIETS